jgi:competence protein ComEC
VSPKLAVVSLGRDNEYGHPHAQILALLARRGIPLLRTDMERTVELVSDGKSWEVLNRRHAPRGPPIAAEKTGDSTKRSKAKHEDRPKPGGRVNINRATEAELEVLPGIGPVIARRIIEGRPYTSVADIDRVKGIGKRRLEEIRPLIKVD